jgi:predicted RNA binding protein YcfA (HicA-like mRNA interferase family)/predicted RNase H-like HicB family nuclease
VKVRDVVRILEREGWQLVRQKGSHRQFRHPERPGTVTVPGTPGSELKPGTLVSVWKQPGIAAAEKRVTEYLVVIEGGGNSWSAYVPDLPGCVSAGVSRVEVEQLAREAIAFHIESMREHQEPVPPPSARAAIIVRVA